MPQLPEAATSRQLRRPDGADMGPPPHSCGHRPEPITPQLTTGGTSGAIADAALVDGRHEHDCRTRPGLGAITDIGGEPRAAARSGSVGMRWVVHGRRNGQLVQTFQPELSPLHQQVLRLLGVPSTTHTSV